MLESSARAPQLFDPSIKVAAAHYTVADDVAAAGLPAALVGAVPKRRSEFVAGRHVAARALAELAPRFAGAVVGVGEQREPLWPAGVVGSLTHAHGFAAAAVADAAQWRALGIDSEKRIDAARAREIAGTICRRDELEALPRVRDPETTLTLLFSAKESLFKALFPLVRRWFDFLDADLVALDAATGALELALRVRLSDEHDAGTRVAGRFEVDGAFVHTGIALARGD